MEEVFLIQPSKEYKDEFIQMVQDYEKYGEIEKSNIYKDALDDFDNYIKSLIAKSKGTGLPETWGIRLPEVWVSCYTYWLVNNYKKIFGVIRIRKELNSEFLKNIGGHIGYDIRPSERKKGYATKMVSLTFPLVKKLKIKKALVTCDKTNIASSKTITNNGGVLENEIIKDGKIILRYWINIKPCYV